jgi:hypothetical protein
MMPLGRDAKKIIGSILCGGNGQVKLSRVVQKGYCQPIEFASLADKYSLFNGLEL